MSYMSLPKDLAIGSTEDLRFLGVDLWSPHGPDRIIMTMEQSEQYRELLAESIRHTLPLVYKGIAITVSDE